MSKSELTSIVNKCCDILRTDDGITGPVHYTEVLSWMLYLKFFQDKEHERAQLAELEGSEYTPLLKKEYQWDSWTSQKKALTGDLYPKNGTLK